MEGLIMVGNVVILPMIIFGLAIAFLEYRKFKVQR